MIKQRDNLKKDFYNQMEQILLSNISDIYFLNIGNHSPSSVIWKEIFGVRYKEILPAAEKKLTPDEIKTRLQDVPFIDFIRIDSNQHGLEFLSSIENMFKTKGVLGIEIKIVFFESNPHQCNQYSDIDSFLKPLGFTLFDMYVEKEPRKVSSYELDSFYNTVPGPVKSATALYFRDLGDTDYEKKFDFTPDKNHIIKLSYLLSIYDLYDCTAELLINHQKKIDLTDLESTTLLDHLTPPLHGKKLNYSTYIEKFQKNPQKWFPKTTVKQSIKSLFRRLIPWQ